MKNSNARIQSMQNINEKKTRANIANQGRIAKSLQSPLIISLPITSITLPHTILCGWEDFLSPPPKLPLVLDQMPSLFGEADTREVGALESELRAQFKTPMSNKHFENIPTIFSLNYDSNSKFTERKKKTFSKYMLSNFIFSFTLLPSYCPFPLCFSLFIFIWFLAFAWSCFRFLKKLFR